MSSTAYCVVCENKSVSGVFKCEGCSLTFCLKHTNEHRQYLNHQLNRIILDYENNFQRFRENVKSSALLDQIDEWEKSSIIKIQEAAANARIQVQRFAESQKELSKQKYHQIAKELEDARQHNEHLERDLQRWKILLQQFQYDLTILSPSIILQQDRDQVLINKINIVRIDQPSILNDKLVSLSNEIQFDTDHHVAMHCGPRVGPAYVTGTQEYSSGRHQIRLFICKITNEFTLSFNIMPKSMTISSTASDSQFLTYGWQSDDCINPSQYHSPEGKSFRDLKGKTQFHIVLYIDCDKQKINYYNENTKTTREINVDVKKCPLPWKLYFYLYDIGDTVRLLSSSQLS